MVLNQAANIVISNKILDSDILIYSDSQAALLAIKSMMTSSKLVLETKHKWNHSGSRNNVHFSWVKAHVGTTGNERADELAKAGIGAALHPISPRDEAQMEPHWQ